jgi:cyclic pyranopterin monophosphate synthase
MSEFSHLDKSGKPSMVNVGHKEPSFRKAIARSIVVLPQNVYDSLIENNQLNHKGPIFQTAVLAGIMAAKKTGDLIPLCHPVGMDHCNVDIRFNQNQEIEIYCEVSVFAKTGIEMEALVGANLAALCIYDMCKALSHEIVIKECRLIHKSGGKSEYNHHI